MAKFIQPALGRQYRGDLGIAIDKWILNIALATLRGRNLHIIFVE